MKINILASTSSKMDLLYTAARTCKSKLTPETLHKHAWEAGEPQKIQLLKALWNAKHYSVFEHISFSFAIEGISRACLAQLSRHRHLSLSVQSQRYVDLIKEGEGEFIPGILPISIEAYPDRKDLYMSTWIAVSEACNKLNAMGAPLEDVRMLYPEGTTTNLVLTANLRTIGELYKKRVDTPGAQWEIKDLVTLMVKEVDKEIPWFGEMIGLRS